MTVAAARTGAEPKFPVWWVIAVLLAALALRVNALWLPHWRGDQAQYVILAMKLTHEGLDGYNLRKADMGVLDAKPYFGNNPAFEGRRVEFTAVQPAEVDGPGMYLQMLKSFGQGYYDEPLHVRAPLLPYLLSAAHRALIRPSEPFLVLSYGFRWSDNVWKYRSVWSRQLWAAAIPLFFNLATIFLVSFLSWIVFRSRRAAVYAAILLAANPLSIWLAHRILTEDPTAFWVTAMFCVLAARGSRIGPAASALAGLFAGLTVLTNQRAGLVLPAAGIFMMILVWQDSAAATVGGWTRRLLKYVVACLRHPFFWIYAAVFLAVTWFWFAKVIAVYGHPLHQPTAGMTLANTQDLTGWFAAVRGREHPLVLFGWGTAVLCPLFAAAYATWNRGWSAATGANRDASARGTLLLWIWILVFYVYLSEVSQLYAIGNKEHRYFYPAYPAIAVLAGSALARARQWAASKWSAPGAEAVTIALLIVNAWWGCRLAYPKVFGDQLLF